MNNLRELIMSTTIDFTPTAEDMAYINIPAPEEYAEMSPADQLATFKRVEARTIERARLASGTAANVAITVNIV